MKTLILENPEVLTQEKESSSWQVVVYNDPVNLMSYVAMVFQKVFGLTKERAEKQMLEVHHLGKSILWVGAREEGEVYVEKLQGYLLMATLEQIV